MARIKATGSKDEHNQSVDSTKLNDHIQQKAKKVTDQDVEDLLKRQHEVEDKLKGVPGKLKKMVNQVKLLFEMVKDYWKGDYSTLPWFSIAVAVVALVYFLSPVDLIPDFLPIVGYVDDAAMIGLAIMAIQEDLRKYCEFKKYDMNQYF